ncbi:MAG: hypothetical protein KKF30_19095 [Proteobacteria bacterium]|nr:hypothetical protein [Pseudomonadota bacterium]
MARWFIISSLLCAFITTIDTWLIGTIQHSVRDYRRVNTDLLTLSPFFLVVISLAIVMILFNVPKGIYVVGLLIFPFLFFNSIFLIAGAFPSVKVLHDLTLLKVSIISGVIFSISQIYIHWKNLESLPHTPVLFSGIAVYSIFIVPSIWNYFTRLFTKQNR